MIASAQHKAKLRGGRVGMVRGSHNNHATPSAIDPQTISLGEEMAHYLGEDDPAVRELRPLLDNPDQHYSLSGETYGARPRVGPIQNPLTCSRVIYSSMVGLCRKSFEVAGLGF